MIRVSQRRAFVIFVVLQSVFLTACGPSIRVPRGGFHADRGQLRIRVEPELSDGMLEVAVTITNTSEILAFDVANASYTLLSRSLVEIPPRTGPICTLPVLLAGEQGSCTFSYEVSRRLPLPVSWEASIGGNIIQFRFED